MRVEQDVPGLERVGAQTYLRCVCKLPHHSSGFTCFSSSTLKKSASLFKYRNLKCPFLPVKLVKIPCEIQERRMLCPVALHGRREKRQSGLPQQQHRSVLGSN